MDRASHLRLVMWQALPDAQISIWMAAERLTDKQAWALLAVNKSIQLPCLNRSLFSEQASQGRQRKALLRLGSGFS